MMNNVCVIDIGYKNFAFLIYSISNNSILFVDICKIDIRNLIPNSIKLIKYISELTSIDKFYIEGQHKKNKICTKISTVICTYLSIYHFEYEMVNANDKYKYFGLKFPVGKSYQRKKWAVVCGSMFLKILLIDGTKLCVFKKKDDVYDCVLMLIISLELLPKDYLIREFIRQNFESYKLLLK